jgi:hypothetical protein
VRELTLRRERDILSLERRLHPVEDARQVDREMANISYALYEKCSAKVVRLSGLLAANRVRWGWSWGLASPRLPAARQAETRRARRRGPAHRWERPHRRQ